MFLLINVTRAVANYLQTLFDKEAEHGKKVIPINNLLAGKTRKEASRMFFETLVCLSELSSIDQIENVGIILKHWYVYLCFCISWVGVLGISLWYHNNVFAAFLGEGTKKKK